MKKILFLLLSITLGALIINSCTDNATNPDTTRNLFPSGTGSYWIYHRTYTEAGVEKTAVDSIAIVGKETVQAKSADKYSVYNAGVISESYFRYSDSARLYALPSELLPADLLTLIPTNVLPQDWVKIADDKATTWDMFQFTVTDIPVNVSGMTATLNGVIKVTATKAGTTVFKVDSVNYTAQEFDTKITYTGKINAFGTNSDLTFSVESKAYYADKVGLIKSETPQQPITYSGIPIYTIQATSRLAHHFHIK